MNTDNRAYYDAFSSGYDSRRSYGYHKLIDDQAAALVKRVAVGKTVLEVGCGTGLILERVCGFASEARGIDVSPGMLEKARERGLEVGEGSATALPFKDASFDVAYSFKVLAHVPDFGLALREMARVVRPGGHMVFDVYNRSSFRYLVKRALGPMKTSEAFDEAAIGTRFLSVQQAKSYFPPGLRLIDTSGIRIATVHPGLLRVPWVADLISQVEWKLMDSPLARFAGFVVFCLERTE
ncbi:MAG: class I SAM-dependent methyltransferase [Nannocystaceae bacterium]